MSTRDRFSATVFYDADCRYCVEWARRFERVLGRRRLAVVPLQTPGAAATLDVPDELLFDEMRLRTQDGAVFGGADAVAAIARRIWWAWPIWAVSQLPGAMRPLRATYMWIARRRGCTNAVAGDGCKVHIALAYLPVVYILAATQPVAGQTALPSRLDAYFTNVVKLTSAERTLLLAGSPVTRNLDADPAKEVAVFGAIWIGAPIAKYVAALQDIENFEKGGGFRVTKRVSEPARLQDFAQLVLPDEDVRDLKSCRVGACELKVSAEALARLRKEVDWSRPDAKAQLERFVRTMAVEYVNGYREGGNARLAVYRDTANPTFVANEFRELVRGMPELAEYVPDMRQYLLDYPKPAVRATTSFVYWQEAEFGLKPTIRLNHVAIQEGKEATVVASKQLYSSHYFWTALEMRALVPDPARGAGFWFVSVSRSRSDGLTGFVGRIIRGKVREGARRGLESALTATKTRLESR